MNPEIDKLARALNLSVYQENVLKSNPHCVHKIYAPKNSKTHVMWPRVAHTAQPRV